MALITEDLRTWLRLQPEIEALVGERVYAVRVQQGSTMPCIVMTLVSTVPTMSVDGFSRRNVRRVQLDLYSDDLDEVYELGSAVFAALVGFEGMMGDTHVQHAFLLSERDLDETDLHLFRRSQDWQLAEET